MTIEREARVPEHPGWQPWWLRYAEYGDCRIVLLDAAQEVLDPASNVYGRYAPARYAVMDVRGATVWGWVLRWTDSLAEAEAAFEAACERLREGG